MEKESIVIYETVNGEMKLEVKLENESLWLTQEQMASLFGRDRSVITKHIGKVFAEEELKEDGNVQNLHIAGSDKPVKFYSLDVVISVGYRVKSKRGTEFRIWATQILKEYLIEGYAINEKRLREERRQLDELKQAVQLMSNVAQNQSLLIRLQGFSG